MLAYSLNLGVLFLVTCVLAEGPGGYMSPWSVGGNMTTFPRQDGTKGTPFNLIISNKSDIAINQEFEFTHYFHSLGYEDNVEYKNTLPRSMQANVGGSNFPITSTEFEWYSPDCKNPQLACLQFIYWPQQGARNDYGARFITAAMANSSAEGVKVIDNGYDLARDQIVSRATLNSTSAPIRDNTNRTQAFKTTVVFNDTELLANISATDLQSGIGTDRRVPILLVEKLIVSENDTLKEFPFSDPSLHGNGAPSITRRFPSARTMIKSALFTLVASLIL